MPYSLTASNYREIRHNGTQATAIAAVCTLITLGGLQRRVHRSKDKTDKKFGSTDVLVELCPSKGMLKA